MIQELSLTKFGCFENRQFRFGDTVIFFGPNEAGKTTLYDAIFTGLCRVPRQGVYKREIYERYGDRMDAELSPEDLAESFTPDEFKDLYSIRSGDVSLNIGSNAPWLDTVKAALFSGGINPVELAEEMGSFASDKGTLKHNKELESLRSKLGEMKSKLDSLEAERKKHGERETRGESMKKEIVDIETATRKLGVEIALLEQELESQERIRSRKELEAAHQLLEEEIRLGHSIRGMESANPEVLKSITEDEKHLEDFRREENALSAVVERLDTECREKESSKLETDRRVAEGMTSTMRARSLVDRIRDFLADPARRTRNVIVWNRLLAALFIVIACTFLVLGIVSNPLFLLGMLAGLGVLIARKVETIENTQAIEGLASQVRDDFRNQTGITLGSQGLEALSEELGKVIAEQEKHVQESSDAAAWIEKRRNEINEKTNELQAFSVRIKEASMLIQKSLSDIGVKTKEELVGQIRERTTLNARLSRVKAEIADLVSSSGYGDENAYAANVHRQLSDMDRDGIPRTGKSVAEVQSVQKRLGSLRLEKEELTRKLSTLMAEHGKSIGAVEYLGKVLEDLMDTQARIEETAAAIENLGLDKEAAAIAAGIFRKLSMDSEAMLGALGSELENSFEGLVPGHREVKVSGFALEDIKAADQGNVVRPIAHLSRGTRDCFTFAARLILALKADPEKKKRLLVLDEPFYSLDPRRTLQALKMVRRVQDERGWQVILFTKDPNLVQNAQTILKDAVVHELAQ